VLRARTPASERPDCARVTERGATADELRPPDGDGRTVVGRGRLKLDSGRTIAPELRRTPLDGVPNELPLGRPYEPARPSKTCGQVPRPLLGATRCTVPVLRSRMPIVCRVPPSVARGRAPIVTAGSELRTTTDE
jgi:hypothetical protein